MQAAEESQISQDEAQVYGLSKLYLSVFKAQPEVLVGIIDGEGRTKGVPEVAQTPLAYGGFCIQLYPEAGPQALAHSKLVVHSICVIEQSAANIFLGIKRKNIYKSKIIGSLFNFISFSV